MANPQFPTNDILRLGLSSGDPSAYQQSNQDQSRLFGLALMDLLKQYQGLEKYPFKKQEFNAQQKQINRSIATDPGLIGASPDIQSSVRGAEVEALEPTVSGARQSGQTFASQLEQFEGILGTGLNILKESASERDKERDDARTVINQALTQFGSAAFDIIDPKYWKLAGYDEKAKDKARQTIKEQELQLKIEKQNQQKLITDSSLNYWAGLLQTGQVGIQNVPMGIRDQLIKFMGDEGLNIISPTFAGKAKEKIDAFNTANNLLDTIEKQAKEAITAKGPFQTYSQQIKGSNLLERFNPKFKVYNDSTNSFLTMLARAAGEKGVITDQDVERIKNGLPNYTDTVETAATKMGNLRNLFESIKSGGVEAYTQPLGSQNTGSTVMTGPDGKKYNVPNEKVDLFKQNGYK